MERHMQPGPGSGTPPTWPAEAGEAPLGLMEVVERVCARLPAASPAGIGSPAAAGLGPWEIFARDLGPRHRGASWENFVPPGPEAREALAALRRYEARLDEHLAAGTGIVLFGPSGTGKDHLLVALARSALQGSRKILAKRVTGPELFRMMRDAMGSGEESRRLDGLKRWPILILSDPLPPLGSLSPFQSSILYEIADYRWEHRFPTWCSLNVGSSREADERLGATVTDRLMDGALVIACRWPSFRRPAEVLA